MNKKYWLKKLFYYWLKVNSIEAGILFSEIFGFPILGIVMFMAGYYPIAVFMEVYGLMLLYGFVGKPYLEDWNPESSIYTADGGDPNTSRCYLAENHRKIGHVIQPEKRQKHNEK